MVELLHSRFAEALGWTLVDSLWQTGLLWTVYCVVTRNGRRYTAAVRHNLALLFQSIGVLWFIGTFVYTALLAGSSTSNRYGVSYLFVENAADLINKLAWLNNAIPFLAVLYVAALGIYVIRLVILANFGSRGIRNSCDTAPHSLKLSFERICSKLGLGKAVRLNISNKVSSPQTTGWWKPIVLLPVSAVTNLNTEQIEAILAHELSHIKRNDYLANYLVIVADILLFFNPFANLFSSIIRKERENSCDDHVVAMGYDAWQYSQALFLLGNSDRSNNGLVLAATGNGRQLLLNRIKRLMKLEQPRSSVVKPLAIFFLCLTVALIPARKVNLLPPVEANQTTAMFVRQTSNVVNEVVTVLKSPAQKTVAPKEAAPEPKSRTTTNREVPESEINEVISEEAVEAESLTHDETIFVNIPTFVAAGEEVEFTFIIREHSRRPDPVVSECPLPYVPGSAFYYPSDSLPIIILDKEVIEI